MRTLVLLFLLGCSSTPEDDILILDGSVIHPDATTTNDAAGDAGAEAAVFNGGGPFTCSDCVCDGTLHLCASGVEGGAPFPDASIDGACPEEDAAGSGCVQIPIDCLPKPSCECIAAHYPNCTCFIVANGSGILMDCP